MKRKKNEAYVLDAFAILAFLEGEESGKIVKSLLETPGVRFYISAVNLGEVYYTILRERDKETAKMVEEDISLNNNIYIIDATWERAKAAGEFKARGGISYADCFAAALAAEKELPLLTGDREFERVADSVNIRWMVKKGPE